MSKYRFIKTFLIDEKPQTISVDIDIKMKHFVSGHFWWKKDNWQPLEPEIQINLIKGQQGAKHTAIYYEESLGL